MCLLLAEPSGGEREMHIARTRPASRCSLQTERMRCEVGCSPKSGVT